MFVGSYELFSSSFTEVIILVFLCKEYITYDIMNLIGEVGGMFGILLGWSLLGTYF